SASRRIVTICSSVNRLFFMTSFLRWKPFSQVSTGPKITGQVKAAATGLGITGLINYVTGKPVTTAEAIDGMFGGGLGGIYGANLNAWAGDAGGWIEKAVLGITKAAPTYAGKQIGISLGNSTGLGGSVDPLVDPATNSWWGFKNTLENF
ncbi:hypothetical protein, partial [Burkholderia gladioli]|uniref:hypothetical protein n=4 Tax=Burkholderia gladioli TaxID=28095 RepID=UPI001ABBC4A2